jgi:RHS repeat-associated protein
MDINGNMIYDGGKGITNSYNFLNLPFEINIDPTHKIENRYDVEGVKWSRTITDGSNNQTRYYIDGIEYLGMPTGGVVIEAINHEEGRIVFSDNVLDRVEYHLRDHLGNIRVAFADLNADGLIFNTEILQENSYYAFGAPTNDPLNLSQSSTSPNRYAYTGQEWIPELGLDWYDHSARLYDPWVGRWWAVDQLAHERIQLNTYNYSQCNPILKNDKSGLLDGDFYSRSGDYLGTDGIDDDKVYLLNEGRSPNYANKSVNWGGKLSTEHAADLKNESSVVDKNSDLGITMRTVYAEMGGGDANAKAIVAESIRNRIELDKGYERADGTYAGVVDKFYDVSDTENKRYDIWTEPSCGYSKNEKELASWRESVSVSIKALYGNSDVGKGVIFYNSSSATFYDKNPKILKINLSITHKGIAGLWKLK